MFLTARYASTIHIINEKMDGAMYFDISETNLIRNYSGANGRSKLTMMRNTANLNLEWSFNKKIRVH